MDKHKLEYNLAIISLCLLGGAMLFALLGILTKSAVLFLLGLTALVTLTPILAIVKIRLTYK